MALWLVIAFVQATIALAKESPSFPAIYTAHYLHQTNTASSASWLHNLDVIEIECTGDDETIDLDEGNDYQSCRGQLLVRSEEELQEIYNDLVPDLRSLDYNATLTHEWVHHRLKVAQDTSENRKLRDGRNLQNYYSTIRFYDCYYDYDGTLDWIRDFWRFYNVDDSPLEVTWNDIGDSWKKTQNDGGFDIFALTITLKEKPSVGLGQPTGNVSASQRAPVVDKAPLLLVSSTHAREYTPPIIVRKWLELLSAKVQQNDPTYLSMLEHTKIHWIPYLNPDGRQLAETSQPFRRKNLNNQWTGNTKDSNICSDDNVGVDLNRNCPFEWGKSDGSSSNACSSFARGSVPGSEPETQALSNYGLRIFPAAQRESNALVASGRDYSVQHVPGISVEYSSKKWRGFNPDTTRGVFVDVHSYGKVYIYPWGNKNSVSPNDLSYRSAMGHVESLTRLDALGPGPDHYGVASGATDDWAYAVLGAFSMTWELGSRFHEPCDDFEERYERHLAAFLYLAQIAPFPYALGRGPVVTRTQLEHNAIRLHYQEVEVVDASTSLWYFDLEETDDNSTEYDELEPIVYTQKQVARMESNTVFDLGESINIKVSLKLPEVIQPKAAQINFEDGIESHYNDVYTEPSSVTKIHVFYEGTNPLSMAPTASSTIFNTTSKYWEFYLEEGVEESEDDSMVYTISISKSQLWEVFQDQPDYASTEHLLYIQAKDNLGNLGPIDAIRLTVIVMEEDEFTANRGSTGNSGLTLTLPPTPLPAPQARSDFDPRNNQNELRFTGDNVENIVIDSDPGTLASASNESSSGSILSGLLLSSLISTLLLAVLEG